MNLNQKFLQRFQKLNAEQKQAVTTIYGPVMVVAGPGSGKTELLSMRVANILRETDVVASNILCLTFTDAATKNMQERLSKIIGVDAFSVGIFTFHSFCQYVLSHYQDYFYEYVDLDLACDVRKFEVISENLNLLSLDRNLRVMDLDGNYVFLSDIQRIITSLKKANLDPASFTKMLDGLESEFENLNQLISEFFAEIGTIRSIKQIDKVYPLREALSNLGGDISAFLTFELDLALAECDSESNTKAFTKFKNKYFAKDEHLNFVIKDSLKLDNLLDFSQIYNKYCEFFAKNGFRDFDDLILDLNKKLKTNPILRANLQETFQFVLVDEFQDTSDAQMELVNLIAQPLESDLESNLLVVGDDDQSIYKFQGANIKNILGFIAEYPDVQTVILDKNYRSNQSIVDLFSQVVGLSSTRLSSFYPSIQKDLKAANPNIETGDIKIVRAANVESEIQYVYQQILELSKTSELSEIAVLARNHADLRRLAEFLTSKGVAVAYESNMDVFSNEAVLLLCDMIVLLSELTKPTLKRVYDLLPKVLAHPAFGIPTQEIWSFSRACFASRKKWEDFDKLEEFPNIQHFMYWLKQLSTQSLSVSFRTIFDYLIGSKTIDVQENLFDTTVYQSPIKKYYLDLNSLDSFIALEALKKFAEALDTYYRSSNYDISQVVAYISFYQNSRLKLNYKLSLNDKNSVELMTAHGSKGLEFEHVIIFNTTHNNWGKTRSMSKLKLPTHLRLEPESDEIDDMIRLFFVALSRAKTSLFLTYAKQDLNQKDNLLLGFLSDVNIPTEDFKIDLEDQIEVAKSDLALDLPEEDFNKNAFIQPIVDDFVISISAILSFIDVCNSTPAQFLESYILRYPRSTSKQASYGNSMHAALNFVNLELKKNNKIPNLSDIFNSYQKELDRQPLTPLEHELYLEKGINNLRQYMQWHSAGFTKYDLSEYNMASANLYLNSFKVSGSLDRVFFDFDNKTVNVIDYKTGKPFVEFGKGSPSTKLKSFKYKLQLTFYKYLLENHPNYKTKYQFGSAYIHFLDAKTEQESVLEYTPSSSDMDFLLKIINAVTTKIKNLDFPDVSNYEKSYVGVRQFVDDLIAGVI